MKKTLIGVGILAVVIIAAVAVKMFVLSPSAAPTGAGGLTYAKAEPMALPPVGGYQLPTVDLGDGPVPLLTVPLDTWGGYAAVFAANGGIVPSKNSEFYKRGHFAVQLVHVEDATEQLNGYAAGKYPVIWAQMDSVPVLFEAMKTDKRVAPKVLGLFDWSFGGDGILAKPTVKSPPDLKGKTILTSSNTPFAFFLLWYLAQNGLTANDVHVVWIPDADKAVKVFQQNPDVAAWVTWNPFLEDCLNPKSPDYVNNARLMISSKDANQLIADCYIARSDFFQENGKLARAFVEAVASAADHITAATFQDMATFYGLKAPVEAQAMLDDVHIANFPETLMFFDSKNSIGAKKIFRLSQEYSKELGVLPAGTDNDPGEVLVTTVIDQIQKAGLFAGQKNTVLNSFNTPTPLSFSDLENKNVVLTDNVQLFFDPNQDTFDIDSTRDDFKKNMEMLDKVVEQSRFLATTAIELIGNADPSMKEQARAKGPDALAQAAADIQELSEGRANFVRKVLVEHFKLPENRIISKGVGWDNPIDLSDYSKDRRVDVKFVSLK